MGEAAAVACSKQDIFVSRIIAHAKLRLENVFYLVVWLHRKNNGELMKNVAFFFSFFVFLF